MPRVGADASKIPRYLKFHSVMKPSSASTASSEWSIRKLDHLDYRAKLRHWLRSDAWNPHGARLRFLNPRVSRTAVSIDKGHITDLPPMIGRPCFGIPTAYLRYRDHRRYTKRAGLQPAGRCQSCNSREACHWVVEQRLRSTDRLMQAWTEWLQNDGPASFQKANFKTSYARRLWMALYRELNNHPFDSVNDASVSAHYQMQDQNAIEADRKRQATKRRNARRKGELDESDLALLEEAAKRRRLRISLALIHPDCPKELSRLPSRSCQELVDVWLGREILRLEKNKPNAPSIARWIVATRRSNQSKNHAALATRVAKDLNRIDRFERLGWEGSVLLPPLNSATELPVA